jgi:hypothetical protein
MVVIFGPQITAILGGGVVIQRPGAPPFGLSSGVPRDNPKFP